MGVIARQTKTTGGTALSNDTIPVASDFNEDLDIIIAEINGELGLGNIKVVDFSFTTDPISLFSGGESEFLVGGIRIGDFTIEANSSPHGLGNLLQIKSNATVNAESRWLLTIVGDGITAGTCTYTVRWKAIDAT